MSESDEPEDEENYVYSDDEEQDESEAAASEAPMSEVPPKRRDRSDSSSSHANRTTQRLGDSEYVLIDRSDVAQTMAKKAKEVSELLNVSASCAEALLRGAGWSNERLLESFWSDGEALQKKCGVDLWRGNAETPLLPDGLPGLDSDVPLPAAAERSDEELLCRICFCDIEPGKALGAPCGHLFCADCYEAYLTNKVDDEGQTCVTAPCPEDKCQTLVPPNLWNRALAPLAAAPPKKRVRDDSPESVSVSESVVGIPTTTSSDDDELLKGGGVVGSTTTTTTSATRGGVMTRSKAASSSLSSLSSSKKKKEEPSSTTSRRPRAEPMELSSSSFSSSSSSQDHLRKYRKYRVDNFINFSKELRWCPAPNCDKVVRAGPCVTSVKCGPGGCGSAFCMKCGDEAHQPASCELLRLWQEKCQNESETANWILANTKRCPKCQTRIEKNQGCNHMSCSQCKHEFCWMCMGDWSEHGASTGGYYKCNKYDPLKVGDEESDTARAKRELDRYLHFYKRYHCHDQAQSFASKQLAATEKRMVELQESTNGSWIDVQFLKTANEMVIDCRRTLKSTYIFGYYLDPDAHKQRELFENLQEHLEKFTETLSELTELPLDKMDRTEVVNITRVTENFLHNLIQGAENGLEVAGASGSVVHLLKPPSAK
eukprot:CAMPEP_0118905578 /NCGR_PEP_ID=MMETSP1166-20130328/9514_1 /TAXON_ID=1104430 /ORGANISM="Chrysoreinhardia sp, Strain CCMP3193" /LENGTH=655 /DNA_ID=CAMNT_0006844849 /DNA_START=310 /DNA_END=2277 /DNA_ORIENTATION=+